MYVNGLISIFRCRRNSDKKNDNNHNNSPSRLRLVDTINSEITPLESRRQWYRVIQPSN